VHTDATAPARVYIHLARGRSRVRGVHHAGGSSHANSASVVGKGDAVARDMCGGSSGGSANTGKVLLLMGQAAAGAPFALGCVVKLIDDHKHVVHTDTQQQEWQHLRQTRRRQASAQCWKEPRQYALCIGPARALAALGGPQTMQGVRSKRALTLMSGLYITPTPAHTPYEEMTASPMARMPQRTTCTRTPRQPCAHPAAKAPHQRYVSARQHGLAQPVRHCCKASGISYSTPFCRQLHHGMAEGRKWRVCPGLRVEVGEPCRERTPDRAA